MPFYQKLVMVKRSLRAFHSYFLIILFSFFLLNLSSCETLYPPLVPAKTSQNVVIPEKAVKLPDVNIQEADPNEPRTISPPNAEERLSAGLPESFANTPVTREPLGIDNNGVQSLVNPILEDGTPSAEIAILLPLSGPHAKLGQSLLNGAELGLFSLGAHDFVMTSYDVGGGADGSMAIEATRGAIKKALSSGAKIIIGPVLAQDVEVAQPLLAGSNIPLLSFSNSMRVASNGIFVTGSLPDQQVISVADAAIREGRSRFALIAPDNAYGRLVAESLSSYLQLSNAQLVEWKLFKPDATDFDSLARTISNYSARQQALRQERTRLTNLEATGDTNATRLLAQLKNEETFGPPPFDAILLAVTDPNQLLTLAAQLSFYDVDAKKTRFLGLENFESMANLGREPSLQGAIFPSLTDAENNRFAEYYISQYNEPPPNLAGLGFDITVIGAKWLLNGKGDMSELTNKIGYNGAQGLFRLNENGIIQRTYAIIQITPNGTKTVYPAPTQFPNS